MRSLFQSAEKLEKAVKQYGALEGAKSTMQRLAERLEEILEGSGKEE
nr:hypothetical protein [Cohnella sp. CFH 77786]